MKRIFSLLVSALLLLGSTQATAAASPLPGIDISQWQGSIDWSKVGNSDVEFVIIRATHGDYVDTHYALNSAAATSEGIPWTAYSYADPRKKEGTAIEQADLFVATAGLTRGNILPVLDLETTGGLGRNRLQTWVSQWLRRVQNKTGAKAIIYTSPSFWTSAMGDTRRFAERGHKLWIAHWGVRRPTVPAGNWGGRGWTFWQWTSDGSVSGIQGRVDKNRFNGSRIGPRYRIR